MPKFCIRNILFLVTLLFLELSDLDLVTSNYFARFFWLTYITLLNFQLIYFTFGTKDVIEHECKDLDQRLVVVMDGHKVKLPQLEAIVVLNIPCWGAGVRPWKMGAG